MKKKLTVYLLLFIFVLYGCTNVKLSTENKGQITIQIQNTHGTVEFNNNEIISEFLELVNDKRYMTSAGCGFGNSVIVSLDGKMVKKFKIADDGCPTGMLENRNQFIIPYKLYNKLETIMQQHNNSLVVNGTGKPHLFDESKFEMPKMLFEIYLVKDLKTQEASDIELTKLPLEEKPILVNYDMIEYNWVKHEFILSDSFLERELEGKVPLAGKPFVICTNGERIYMGQFWTPISSMMYAEVPLISSVWNASSDNKTYKIEWLSKNKKDPRGDKRIYDALKRAGVLKEPELDA